MRKLYKKRRKIIPFASRKQKENLFIPLVRMFALCSLSLSRAKGTNKSLLGQYVNFVLLNVYKKSSNVN